MANLNSVLNDRISRVARKQIKVELKTLRRLTTQHRRDLAALKRTVSSMQRVLAFPLVAHVELPMREIIVRRLGESFAELLSEGRRAKVEGKYRQLQAKQMNLQPGRRAGFL